MNRPEIAQLARNWYDSSVPPFPTSRYVRFAGRASHIAQYVADQDVDIIIHSTESAFVIHADSKIPGFTASHKARIYIPTGYFHRQWLGQFDGTSSERALDDDQYVAIAVLNGTLIHEANHLRWSPATILDILEAAERGDHNSLPAGAKNVLMTLANAFEDLFIDTATAAYPYACFVEAKNEFYFPDEEFAKRTADEGDSEGESVDRLLNAAIACKNPRHLDNEWWQQTPLRQQLLSLIERVRVEGDPVERSHRVWDAYELLASELGEEAMESDGEGESGGDGEGRSAAVPVDGMDQQKTERGEESVIATTGVDSHELNKDFDAGEAGEPIDKTSKSEHGDMWASIPAIVELDVMDVIKRCSDSPITPHSAFATFGQVLKKLKSIQHPPGMALKRGKLLPTRLYRIATDEKMFARTQPMLKEGESEVIVLVDASGSMSFLFHTVLSASYGIFLSLKQAGTACGVWAHTSQGMERDHPVLYYIASHRLYRQPSNVDERFSTAADIRLSENYDGMALAAVAKHFTQRQNSKVILVLSDGQPYGPGYGGRASDDHTSKVAADLRASGIAVVSISLKSHVVEPNNRIYGQRWNIDASRDLIGQLKAVVGRIETRQL